MWRSGGRSPGGWRATVGGLLVLVVVLGACSSDDGSSDGGSPAEDSAPSNDAEGGASGSFRLLSYNVAGLPQEVSEEQPTTDIPQISPLLEDYDVVLTQEDFDWWTDALDGFAFADYHEWLEADTTFEHRTAQHPGPEAVGITPEERPLLNIGDGLGVLSRFPFTGERRVPWEGCFGGVTGPGAADCLAMKGFLVVRMELAPGVEVDVYDLHGEAGGNPEDQALQADDYAQLASFIAEHSAGRAVIVAGDTNLHTDLEHEDAGDGADIEIWDTFLDATGLTDACTATDCPETGDIDKAAFRSAEDGSVRLEAVEHDFPAERFTDAAGDDLSDHEPLEVVFDWSAA
jgi:hypothetical protein